MAKTGVEELLRDALQDPVFAAEYKSQSARIRRAIGETLIKLRKQAKLTQAAVGERAGWQQPYIAKIERGDSQIVTALDGLENFANAVDATTVLTFLDRKNGRVLGRVPLGQEPEAEMTPAEPATAEDELVSEYEMEELQPHELAALEADVSRGLRDSAARFDDQTRKVGELLHRALRELERLEAAGSASRAAHGETLVNKG
jgi:transcriptional regulator with XRE-family HTH domain